MPSIPGAKIPKGFGLYSLPAMGTDQKQIYDLLKGQFQSGGPEVYQKLFGLAGGKSDLFEQLEVPALRQFQQVIAPEIAARYSGSGISGSSGMQNAIAGAGANLAENLQSQRMGIMERSMQNVLGLGDRLLGTQTNQIGLYQKENLLRDIMQLLGSGASQIGGIYGGSKLAGLL